MEAVKYPTNYELLEVLKSNVSRAFLDDFAQAHGIFITNANQEKLATEISNLYLNNEDLEKIRKEAYHIHTHSALTGFVVTSNDPHFNLKDVYFNIYSDVRSDRRKGKVLNAITDVSGEPGLYKSSMEYNKQRPGRIEFLQDEVSSFDFYMKDIGNGSWQVEIDSNRSTDLKELKELLNFRLGRHEDIIEIDQSLLTTDISIQFFDGLFTRGMDSNWSFRDVKHLTLKRGNDDKITAHDEDVIQEVDKKEDLAGISQAVLQGKNLREDAFVQQSVDRGYRFNAMTYEFEHNHDPFLIHVKAEFKSRPKVFEVSIVGYEEIVGSSSVRVPMSLPPKENRRLRSCFWNNSKILFNELISPVRRLSVTKVR